MRRNIKNLSQKSLVDQVYTVLTLCRVYHTAKTGKIISKEEAGNWCLTILDKKYIGLVKTALANLGLHQKNINQSLKEQLPKFVKYIGKKLEYEQRRQK